MTSHQPAPSPFRPIALTRGFELVSQQIRQAIADGRLDQGDRLPHEKLLAVQIGVSRSAVREGLRSLELAGVLRSQPGSGGGMFVDRPGPEKLARTVADLVAVGDIPSRDVTEARFQLTRIAIEMACVRATEEDFAALERDIESLQRLEDSPAGFPNRSTPALTEFYRLLAAATHNAVIVFLVESMSELMRGMLAEIDLKPARGVLPMRRKLVAHLRLRDARRAVAVTEKHWNALNEFLERSTGSKAATPERRAGRGRG